MSVFILMFELYLWLFMLMVVNTTKTNKVVSGLSSSTKALNDRRPSGFWQVVDTSDIIQDLNDALKTKRTFCILEDDTEFKVKI